MMSFKEFKEVRASKVAGPQLPKQSSSPSSVSPTPSMISSIKEVLHTKKSNIFTFIDDTYQDLKRFNSNLQNNLNGTQLMQTINKYKNGCNEVYSKALDSYDMSHKLAQNIVRTIDIFKELCSCISDLEEYNYRMCEIMSIFIVCELRLSVDATPQEQILIAHRIIYIMRRHLVHDEEGETLYNILRTLVYIPKLFNARDIMCAIFGEFIPIKPVLEVKVLPDKLYILYIIVFYRWMMMQKENDDKILIVNFAQSFMKPSVSLCSNNLYGSYLPMYATHSTATRTILNNLKFYRDIRNASVIDNAFKNIGAVVNLCDDDEEDDIIIEDNSPTCDFAEIFDSARLEALNSTISNIKFEEKTVVSTVDLTEEEEEDPADKTSIDKRHEIWLNEFQMLAQQYRESQLVLERKQNFQTISNGEKEAIICLDSDSEEETEITTDNNDTLTAATANQQNNSEDLLFVDNYPLTDTPINCDSGLDENDVTKLSPRFLSSTLRTYQAKKCTQSEAEDKNSTDTTELNKLQHMDKAYRRNSVHISSTPPESTHNEDDEGTDVQDEHDDDGGEETNTFLLAPNKRTQKEIPAKEIRPMGPYPTYNNINNEKGVFSHSDSSEITKSPKKQKQKVRSYNCKPRKHSSHTHRYKASDALECSHLQEHIAEASTLFRKIIDKERLTQASSSASSVSSRTTCKNSRIRTSKKSASKQRRKTMDKRIDLSNSLESITINGEQHSFIKSSDVYHSGGALLSCDDAKLQKRCAVVITPSQEVVRYEREMYNKILLEQRKNLELRALEKQKEKELERERKKRDYWEKSMENTATSIKSNKPKVEVRNTNIIFNNIETGYDTNFQMRIRKPKQENNKVVQPLNIQIKMTETTTTLLSKIDAHLHTPAPEISIQQAEKVIEQKKQQKENQERNDINQHICDINNDKVQTKLGELDLLADIAQNLSPYQLDNNPPNNPSPDPELSPQPPALEIQRNKKEVPKEKITVTEHLIIQSVDNLLEKTKPHLNNDQEHKASINYAHEPKLKNVTTILKSSLNTNLLQNQNQLKNKDNLLSNNLDGKGTNSEIQINKTNDLEQILEESINVLKPVNNYKFNIINECSSIPAHPHGDSKSGILISNVESLNHFEQNDTVQLEKSDGTCTIKSNSKNLLLIENELHDKEEMYEKTKDQTFEQNRNLHNTKSVTLLPPTIINKVESGIMHSNLHKISSENDLSNICLESEISTHSSEIAEPSPVVTDMSDNSNESEPFKDLDNPFTQTPTISNIIPLKFGPQSETQSNSTSLKNSLEPEADYNVTKFLDFILSKTVTDDESETRDKIIKELNVLTVDTMLETPDNASKKDVLMPLQSELIEQQKDIKSVVFTEERKTLLEKKISEENANIFKGETNKIEENCKLQQTLEYSSQSHIEYKSNAKDNRINEVTKTTGNSMEQNVSLTPCANNNNDELNPPIENQENKKDVIVTAKNSNVVPPSPGSKINQSINTKCVVRLKRINATKKETWMAIPPNTKRNISKCDIVMKTNKKLKLETEQSTAISKIQTVTTEQLQMQATPTSTASTGVALSSALATKPRTKPFKTVTFDLKNCRPPKKLPENTLRAAETLQLLVNNINDSVCTAPPTDFNKKRSSIKNKCIAEDETPRPPPASALMGTLPCKKTCTEKSRSQATLPISSITNDISTARIYTSSPLDQTLPEYDDNVDTVADSELILPAGSLRRKLKRPKKSLTRDVNNQSDCNGEDDTDAVVDNEDDVFAEEILPIPVANEHILEEIVSARPPHISAATVIRDNYMSIEETPTVPAYLFNDESHDSPCTDPSETRNVVDSSSSSSTIPNNVTATNPPSTTSVNKGNLEKSMLSPSEHEVSSTQETFYQTPTKNKQQADEKSSASNDNGNSSSGYMTGGSSKQKLDDINKFQNKEDYQSTSTNFLLQNNQVDTTNHSPEMYTLTLTAPTASRTATTNITTNITNNRKIHKTSTHDEILFSELQQQFPTATPFLPESTSDKTNKTKIQSKNLDGILNGEIFSKAEEKVKFLKSASKRDIIATNPTKANVTKFASAAFNNSYGRGGSSPSTTTIINEDNNERSSKIILKPSQLHPANPLKITIPISLLNRSRSSSLESPNSKLFMGKNKEMTTATAIFASPTTKNKKEQLKTNTSSNSTITNTTSSNSTSSSSKTTSRNSKNADLTFPPDKYDLIKSKEKHHRYYDDQEDIKAKSKDKTNSQSKTSTSNNSRSHKNSTKEKVKGKKPKQKHKLDDGIKKVTISQSKNKASSSSLSLTPTPELSKSNNKQNNNKSSKNTSGYSTMASSSSALSSSPAILKDVNLSNTPVLIASTQSTTAALSTNNVRKKLKIK